MKILLADVRRRYDRLWHLGHDVYSVTKLHKQEIDIQGDSAVDDYAKENGMVLVTRDNKFAKYCKAVGTPHIHLDDDDLFKMLRQKINECGAPV